MPRLASITSQSLTGITLALADAAQAAYSIALTASDNANSTGSTLFNGETATFTITAVDDTVTDPLSFITPTIYWSINATTADFTAVSGSISIASNSHDGNTTMTTTYSLNITVANPIGTADAYTITIREGAVDGPVVATSTVTTQTFVPPPGNWTDDNGDPVTVATIISPLAMQLNGVFAANPGVPIDIEGVITGTTTTITAITANTGTLLEVTDTGGATGFQVGEELNIV